MLNDAIPTKCSIHIRRCVVGHLGSATGVDVCPSKRHRLQSLISYQRVKDLRVDLAYTVSELACVISNSRLVHWKATKNIPTYPSNTFPISIALEHQDRPSLFCRFTDSYRINLSSAEAEHFACCAQTQHTGIYLVAGDDQRASTATSSSYRAHSNTRRDLHRSEQLYHHIWLVVFCVCDTSLALRREISRLKPESRRDLSPNKGWGSVGALSSDLSVNHAGPLLTLYSSSCLQPVTNMPMRQ